MSPLHESGYRYVSTSVNDQGLSLVRSLNVYMGAKMYVKYLQRKELKKRKAKVPVSFQNRPPGQETIRGIHRA